MKKKQKIVFCPNQHLSKQGYKTDNKFLENCIDRLLGYSTAYYDVASATEDWLYHLDKNLSLEPDWSGNFCFFLAEKTLEAKPDSVAIFRDSKLVDATLLVSQSFKPRQFL